MANEITAAEAVELMFQFISENLTAVDNVRQEGSDFLAKKDGIDIVLRTTATPIKPAKGYTADVRANSKAGIANGLLQVRSTTNYDGELLRQAVYMKDGKNLYYTNKKQLTAFEQEVVRLYGAPIAYYNPQEDRIENMRLIRSHRIPKHLQPKPGCDGSEQPKDVRRQRHMHEDLRERVRKISITDRIECPFTFEVYKRKGTGVLIARMVPYAV